MDTLAHLVQQAGDRIIVMPGCGITTRNFERLHRNIGAKEYHVFLPQEAASRMAWRPSHIYMGGMLRQAEFSIVRTDPAQLQTILEAR